jgi:bicarbonate transport system substrate-binding protein
MAKRRRFLVLLSGALSTTLLLTGCLGNPPNRQGSTSTAAITKVPVATANPDLEVKTVSLGYIPILEAAPLVVGVEKGFFARHGLEVNLSKQSSWGAARDNLVLGAAGGGIDGGQ